MNSRNKEIEEKLSNLTEPEIHEISTLLRDAYGIEYNDAILPAGNVYQYPKSWNVRSTIYTLVLTGVVNSKAKMQVIRAVKDITGLGLTEAKWIVERLPYELKGGIQLHEAEELESKLVELGGIVEIVKGV